MDLGLNETQEMLRTAARDFLEQELPKSVIRELEAGDNGHSPELWRKVADLGWLGLVFPEQYGGGGAGLLDLAVLYEECGRALMPTTFYSTIAAGLAILNGGSEAQKREYLPKIARGELIGTIALTEPSASYEPDGIRVSAEEERDHFVVNGTKLFIQNAHVADCIVAVVRTESQGPARDGISVLLIDGKSPGITSIPLKTFGGDKQSEVVFNNVRVPQQNLLGGVNQGWPLMEKTLEQMTALQCAEMVGGAQACFEMTLDYVKFRVQFGRPIGSFQAVQHHCANMATDVDGARYVTYQAAWRLGEGLPAAKEIAIAKAWTGQAYKRVTLTAHQLHGGIGFVREYDVQFYTRRAKATELSLGTPDQHLEKLAVQLGL